MTMSDVEPFQECLTAYVAARDARQGAYIELLAQAEPILGKQREQDRRLPPNFNIFQVLGHAYREVSTHSALLAHLLDPAASHAQQARFLSIFLQIVQGAASRQGKERRVPSPQNPWDWRCRPEAPLPDGLGRVDILLRGPDLLIIIENKIFAGDQKNQLQDYWRFASQEARAYHLRPIVIYLTPDGRRPAHSTREAPKLEDNLILMSYHEDIYQFIIRSLDALDATSVAEILRQYATLVKGL
jgi:hypothetical protein